MQRKNVRQPESRNAENECKARGNGAEGTIIGSFAVSAHLHRPSSFLSLVIFVDLSPIPSVSAQAGH